MLLNSLKCTVQPQYQIIIWVQTVKSTVVEKPCFRIVYFLHVEIRYNKEENSYKMMCHKESITV